jgi:hypothetical protein
MFAQNFKIKVIMKNAKFKVTKFNLEKFEVAKLSNMKSIKGGGDTESDGITTGDTGRVSSRVCTSIGAPTLPTPTP